MIRRLCLRTRPLGWLGAGLALLTFIGCPPVTAPDGFEAGAKLVPFTSSGQLLDYFREQARARTSAGSWGGLYGCAAAELPVPAAASPGGTLESNDDRSGNAADESPLYSTTNVQEAGVDESDVVKSDGTYFYIASGTTLRIVRARPADQLAEIGRLELDVSASEMYLYGSKLLLLAQRYEEDDGSVYPALEIWPPYLVGSNLTVVEVDISDPAAPTATKQVSLDGALVDSRLTNERLILVLTVAPDLPAEPTRAAIDLMPLEAFMPQVRDAAGQRDMVQWQDCLHPESPDGYFLTVVLTLDADDIESILHSVAVVGGAGTIYASTAALYITDTEYSPEDGYREMTTVHKFAFDDAGVADYVASGSVPGRLLNQFSLGEYQDYLRVATHVTDPAFFGWGPDTVAVGVATNAQTVAPPEGDYNAVYVLGQNGTELETVGAVENIAPDEDLHSARFIGDHGFVVTYYQVDPLFILDLSDPTAPVVVGHLHVPGFSDYLHPLDETHLIGVGRATVQTDEGFDWFQGVQVSLFDVSDWSEPTVVEQRTFGGRGSSSEVDYTHKGFTLLADRGLLAIPMRLYTVEETPWEVGEPMFDGVVCLQVDPETGFTELGRIDALSAAPPSTYYFSDYGWRRAAFIGDTLYAISVDGVNAAALSDLTNTTTLELEE
jgi:inhibitor of cysteine peptidase